jgi:hypothetical protein
MVERKDDRWRACVPSGAIPRRTNGNASLAPAHTKRKSQGSCRPVTPTPAACPFTAAMVIFRQRKIASVILPPVSLWAGTRASREEEEKPFFPRRSSTG